MNRPLLAMATTVLVATACAPPDASPLAHSSTSSSSTGTSTTTTATTTTTAAATSTGAAAPSPWPAPTPYSGSALPIPAGHPTPAVKAAITFGPGQGWQVALVAPGGAELAHTAVGGSAPMLGGPGGAYWIAGGRMMRLDLSGRVSNLGVAGGDSFAISPDGTEWAYSAMTTPAGADGFVNQLWVGGTAHAPRLIASRRASASGPTPPDAPSSQWAYRVLGWNDRGIVITRMLTGICGCGPFADEHYHGHVALVDPQTGVATPVTDDEACPVSGIADDGTYACFEPAYGSVHDIALRISRDGTLLADYALSGDNRAGAAVFEPAGGLLAYATVPTTLDPDPASAATVLRVLDLRTGETHAVGPAGLLPLAWMPDGRLIAQRTVESGNGSASVAVVIVDRSTGQLTTITSGSDIWIAGVATE